MDMNELNRLMDKCTELETIIMEHKSYKKFPSQKIRKQNDFSKFNDLEEVKEALQILYGTDVVNFYKGYRIYLLGKYIQFKGKMYEMP